MPWLRTVSIDDPSSAWPPWRVPPRTARRCSPPGAVRAGGRAPRPGRPRGERAARRRPVGVARRVDVRSRRPRPGEDGRGAERVQRGLRPGARRARAKGASRSPARPAVRPTSPSRSTWSALAPTPTTSPRPPSAWRGYAPAGETSRARSARWTSCPRPAGPSPRRGAAGRSRRVGRWAGIAGGGPGQHRQPHHRPRRPVTVPRRRAQLGAGLVESQGADTTVWIAGRPAAEPALRDGLEAAYRDRPCMPRAVRSGSTSSTRRTRSADGRCDDGAGDERGRGQPPVEDRSPGDGEALSCPPVLLGPVTAGSGSARPAAPTWARRLRPPCPRRSPGRPGVP